MANPTGWKPSMEAAARTFDVGAGGATRGIDTGFYPLGSCTMKYNPKSSEALARLPGFANAHPLLPAELAQGSLELMYQLERALSEISGCPATTLTPAAGAQGAP